MKSFLFTIFFFFKLLVVHAEQIGKKNICEEAIHKNTIFKVTGIYGNSIETEWSSGAAYVLLKEMKKLLVLKKEFVEKYFDNHLHCIRNNQHRKVIEINPNFLVHFCNLN